MNAPTFLQTNYHDSNQTGTAYPLAIDADIQIFSRAGNMFACHARATPNMTVEVDPGFVFDPRTQTLTQIGNYIFGNTHTNTTVDGLSTNVGQTNGMGIRGDGIPNNTTISSGAGTTALTISAAATATASSVFLTISQISGTVTAPVANPRIDRVVVDAATGLMSVVTGTEAANPSPPAIPAGKRPVAQILLQTSSTSITSSMITDERAVWGPGVPLIPWTVAAGTGDAITAAYSPQNSALYDGLILSVRAIAANTLINPTFSPDGLTAHTITQVGGQALVANSINGAGHELLLRYNLANTRWELLNPNPPQGSPTGAMIAYAGLTAPTGWLMCDGSAVSRTSFATLFNAITIQTTGNTSASSNIITSIPSTTNMVAGMPISGTNIPAGTTISSVDSASQIHISQNATGTTAGGSIVVAPWGVGDGSTTFNVPDLRGRAPFGQDNMNGSAANRITTSGSGIAGTRVGATGGAETVTLTSSTQASMSVSGSTTQAAIVSLNTASGYSPFNNCVSGGGSPLSAVVSGNSATRSLSGTASGGGAAHQNMVPAAMSLYIIKT